MADQIMRKSVEMDALTPELWSANFYETLLESLPFNDVVDRRYEGEITKLGDQVNISQIPQFSEAEEIAEDQKVDAEAVVVASIPLIINKQVAKDHIITDRALIQSIEASNELRDLTTHSILKKMQSIIIAETVPSAAAPDHQIAYDSGTTLALADILEGKELLDQQDVPDDGKRCQIMDAPQWNDIFNITGFTSRDFVPAGSPLESGSFGSNRILGFNPKLTTLAANVTFQFHPSYLTMAVQREPEVKTFDLGVDGKRAERVNMTALFGVKILDNKRVVTIS